jgi:hypothetical protein
MEQEDEKIMSKCLYIAVLSMLHPASPIIEVSHCGGIGRRRGFKIPRLHGLVSSSLTSGTKKSSSILDAAFFLFIAKRFYRMSTYSVINSGLFYVVLGMDLRILYH